MPQHNDNKPLTRNGMPLQTRALRLRGGSYDPETREFDFVATTSAPVRRWDWRTGREYDEILSMDDVKLERFNANAPILNSHKSWDLLHTIGVVIAESGKTTSDELVGRGRLTSADDVHPIRQRFEDGTIGLMSVGYVLDEKNVEITPADTKTGAVEQRIYRGWEAYEVSIVPIPADFKAGARGADTEQPMTEPHNPAPAATVDENAIRKAATEAATKAEIERSSAIRAQCRKHGIDEQKTDEIIAERKSVAESSALILDVLAERSSHADVRTTHLGGYGFIGDERKVDAVVNALAVRGGATTDQDGNRIKVGREFGGLSLMRLAEDCLRVQGHDPRSMTERTVASLALRSRRGEPLELRSLASAMATGDFPLLLAAVQNKFLREGFAMEPMTHETANLVYDRTVRDTKTINILSLGSFDALPAVAEGIEYTYASIGESRETYSLGKFGRIAPLTIETLLNDDLMAFARIGRELGRAAMRTEKGLIYGSAGVLGSNSGAGQTMAAHGNIAAAPLINSTHGNSGTTGALSATTLAELRKLMLQQTDDDGNRLGGLMPQVLLVPAALLDTAEVLQQARYVPATAATGAAAWINGLRVVAEGRLDAISATRFYLTTGMPFIERARLQGEEMPTITEIEDQERDAIGYKVRYWCAAKAADWRDVASNAGS